MDNQEINTVFDWKSAANPEISIDYVTETKAQLQLLMRQNAGIVRNDADLIKAGKKLSSWKKEIEQQIKKHTVSAALYELRNMIAIGDLIVQQSINRNENRGGFVKI
jgi:L-aspartate oxidase